MIWSVGHGASTADAFAQLLTSAGIERIADVRRFPGSRRHPHFGKDEMARWLSIRDIAYEWIPALGGRRRVQPASPNIALRNPQFRAYADYMATDDFAAGVAALLDAASRTRLAVMCSESVWWRCHRRLLADHLVLVSEAEVAHLFHDGRVAAHPVTIGARRAEDHVAYDVTE